LTIYPHFSLHGAPFDFTPPARLFLSATHRASLETLRWGLEQEPSGLTLLVGEAGTGKTSLIQMLLVHPNVRVRVAHVTNPTLSFDQMLHLIAQEIGIHPIGKDKLAILRSLNTFLMDPEPSDRVVLIFDEAQGLSDDVLEELRLLSNSRTNLAQSLQIVLVGQLELAQRLREPKFKALNQRVGARAMLRPLRGKEIYDYVEHYLREHHGELTIFSRGALKTLARLSGGLPRQINLICRNSLDFASSEGSAIVKSRHVRAAAAEYKNVIAFSTRHSLHLTEAPRQALHWLSSRSMPMLAGMIVTIVAVGAVVAFEMNAGGTKERLVTVESTSRVRPQQPPSWPKSDQGLKLSIPLAAAVRPSQHNANELQPLPQKPAPFAQAIATTQSKTGLGNTNAANAVASTNNAPTKTLETTRKTPPLLASMPVNGTKAPPAKRVLSRQASNTIRYDMKRAKEALRARRYDKAIWHLQRAVALDPDNQVARDLLASAYKAKAVSTTSQVAARSSMGPSAETIATTTPAANMSASGDTDIVREEIQQGYAYMQKGDYDSALLKFKVARLMDPDNNEVEYLITIAEKAKATEDTKTSP
jgi:type II secretory pathway predicted ATPase ExeA